jgi:hypothetical protein
MKVTRLILLLTGVISVLLLQRFFVNMTGPDQIETQKPVNLIPIESFANYNGSLDIDPFKSNGATSTVQPVILLSASDNLKKIQVFGRVLDEYRQPVENVLVSEDRYFYYTRSNSDGLYRLTLKLPKHKFPVLNFLRSGYEGDRVYISADQTKNSPEVELNVTLLESTDSIKVSGWIGNEIGENLPGQKIGIFSRGSQSLKNIDQTAVSDENGEFVFEALKPDIDYELEVYTSPQYAPYSIHDLILTRTTPRLNIVLKKLKFLQVSGMFVDVHGAPVPNFEIDMINISTGIHLRKIVSDSSGFFSLDNFPSGEVRFSSRPPEHFTITGLKLTENEYKQLTLVVDKGSYQLSGWIIDQNGVAVNRAMVLFDAEVTREGIKSASNRSSVTDSNGYFHFDQLANTPHQITIYATGFNKKEILHRFQSRSSEVFISLSPQ